MSSPKRNIELLEGLNAKPWHARADGTFLPLKGTLRHVYVVKSKQYIPSEMLLKALSRKPP
jgi:hypothetical protein